MTSKFKIFCLLWLAIILPCQSKTDLVRDEIQAYNQGNYQLTIDLGRRLIDQQAATEISHYYLAHAYLKMGDISHAYSEYAFCAQSAKDATLRLNAKAALDEMNNISSSHKSESKSSLTLKPSGLATTPLIKDAASKASDDKLPAQNTSKPRPFSNLQNNLNAVRLRAQQERLDALIRLSEVTQVQADKARADMPSADSRDQLKTKLNALYKSEQQSRKEIERNYRRQVKDLNTAVPNALSQTKLGLSGIQLEPNSSNLYIKNYVNYSALPPQPFVPPPPPVGLRAIIKSLN